MPLLTTPSLAAVSEVPISTVSILFNMASSFWTPPDYGHGSARSTPAKVATASVLGWERDYPER
jgi:hypothetical protein